MQDETTGTAVLEEAPDAFADVPMTDVAAEVGDSPLAEGEEVGEVLDGEEPGGNGKVEPGWDPTPKPPKLQEFFEELEHAVGCAVEQIELADAKTTIVIRPTITVERSHTGEKCVRWRCGEIVKKVHVAGGIDEEEIEERHGEVLQMCLFEEHSEADLKARRVQLNTGCLRAEPEDDGPDGSEFDPTDGEETSPPDRDPGLSYGETREPGDPLSASGEGEEP